MKTILTVVGARPQFIKAAAISRAIRTQFSGALKEIIVHTGQHYDENMSAIFFEELNIPKPDYNLEVGSETHGAQTGRMMQELEHIIIDEKPDCVLVYGDTNSTLAGALTAAKLGVHVVHVEAGLRSFNKRMPEEINRITTDHVSSLLFASSDAAIVNLKKEGFDLDNAAPYHIDNPKLFRCGDVMFDNSLFFRKAAIERSTIFRDHKIDEDNYILVTIHRDNNTDDASRLNAIFSTLGHIAQAHHADIVLPLHPRTKKMMDRLLTAEVISLLENERIKILPPVSYFDMIALEAKSQLLMTDSGGLQKEAFFFQKPCIILRHETEWIELVQNGNAMIADADEAKILEAFKHYKSSPELSWPSFYGDGHAAEFICSSISEFLA